MRYLRIIAGGALLGVAVSACKQASDMAVDGKATLVGTWSCVSKSGGGIPDVSDTQTFTADGWFSSSKFPEGKKYKYRLENGTLMVSFPAHEWAGKIARLTIDAFDYDGDAAGETKVSCRKS